MPPTPWRATDPPNGSKHGATASLIGSSPGSISNILSDLTLGREYNARYLNARMDEVRVSSVARSSNWLWATWQNIASNAAFNSYGAAALVASNLPPSLASVSNRSGNVGIALSVTNTASDPDVPAQRLFFSLLNPPGRRDDECDQRCVRLAPDRGQRRRVAAHHGAW